MSDIKETIAYFEQQLSYMNSDLEDFKSGRRETFDLADGTRTNTTAQTIAEIERRKLNLQRVIAAYRDQLE